MNVFLGEDRYHFTSRRKIYASIEIDTSTMLMVFALCSLSNRNSSEPSFHHKVMESVPKTRYWMPSALYFSF